jgi:hypothetical protein
MKKNIPTNAKIPKRPSAASTARVFTKRFKNNPSFEQLCEYFKGFWGE